MISCNKRWRNYRVSQVDQYTSWDYTLNSTKANMDDFTMDCLSDTKAHLSWQDYQVGVIPNSGFLLPKDNK